MKFVILETVYLVYSGGTAYLCALLTLGLILLRWLW